MFKKFILLLLLLANVSAVGQNLLKEKWKFRTGDDLSWIRHDFDDTDWKEIKAGKIWEEQGYQNYDGFAWYRQAVIVPATLRAAAVKNGGFVLNLGTIDDADYTYFNGELVGKTGDVPPNYISRYEMQRSYTIPIDKIIWDQPNYIAIRVYDERGGGGISGQPIEFKVKGSVDNLALMVAMPVANHIFINNSQINIPIEIRNSGADNLGGSITIDIIDDFGKKAYNASAKKEIKKNTLAKQSFTLPKLLPGFYHATVSFESSLANKNLDFWFGVDPEKIVSPVDAEADIEDYWKRAKKELAAVEPQYHMILVDSLSKGTKNTYVVEMRSLGNVLVRGWYCIPKKPGKYPAILHVQGYGSFLKTDWMYPRDDMVSFGLNIRGHGFSKDNIDPFKSGDYILTSLEDKEMYIYRGAYMDCRRAVDFLFSRPEVDTTKVVVEGGSQGGALSIATAALNNNRIKLCLPHVPFLSDFKDYFKTAVWPGNQFKLYMQTHPGVSWDLVYKTLSYIDIKNLAPWVKCPTLMAIGLRDNVCPPHINFAAYNQVRAPKEYVVYPNAGHGLPNEYHTLKYEWIKKQFGIR